MSAGATQSAPALRVVLDTNVVLSALLFRNGRLAALRTAWQSGRLIPVVSRETLQELSWVLAYPKFALSAADIRALMALFLPHVQAHPLPSPSDAAMRLGLCCADPKDQVFLELALSAAVDALVTGDADLLTLRNAAKEHGALQIMAPHDVLLLLQGQG